MIPGHGLTRKDGKEWRIALTADRQRIKEALVCIAYGSLDRWRPCRRIWSLPSVRRTGIHVEVRIGIGLVTRSRVVRIVMMGIHWRIHRMAGGGKCRQGRRRFIGLGWIGQGLNIILRNDTDLTRCIFRVPNWEFLVSKWKAREREQGRCLPPAMASRIWCYRENIICTKTEFIRALSSKLIERTCFEFTMRHSLTYPIWTFNLNQQQSNFKDVNANKSAREKEKGM